jgi:RNA polymerase sigma-70 factor (ECF subfamily)
MLIPPTDSIQDSLRAFPAGVSTIGSSAKPSEVECAVIHLFEEFRNPLLRYVISLGLSLHDGEEVIQEVFLALFRHLKQGKSRRNLRGWVFRVAHNLALKQQMANKKALVTLDSDEGVAQRQPDATPNPEEQAAAGAHASRSARITGAGSLLPLSARGGTSLPGNRRCFGNFAGRRFDRADALPDADGTCRPRMMPW